MNRIAPSTKSKSTPGTMKTRQPLLSSISSVEWNSSSKGSSGAVVSVLSSVMVDPPVPFVRGRKVPETAARGAALPEFVAGGRQAIGGLARVFLFLNRTVNVRPQKPAGSRRFAWPRFAVEARREETGMSSELGIQAF